MTYQSKGNSVGNSINTLIMKYFTLPGLIFVFLQKGLFQGVLYIIVLHIRTLGAH